MGLATVRRPQTLADMDQLLVDLGTPDGPLARFVNIQHATPQPGQDGSVTVATSYRCWPEERSPGALVTTAFPHHVDFEPDERAIGTGVRAMAGRLAERARRG